MRMNPRILKKLTKKSAVIIEQLGLCRNKSKVIVGVNDVESVETYVKVDLKHQDRWYKGNRHARRCFAQLTGTVGYGRVSGYSEPEWEDSCAWSILRDYVIDGFNDWENFDGESDLDNNCPRKVRSNPSGIFRHAKTLLETLKSKDQAK